MVYIKYKIRTMLMLFIQLITNSRTNKNKVTQLIAVTLWMMNFSHLMFHVRVVELLETPAVAFRTFSPWKINIELHAPVNFLTHNKLHLVLKDSFTNLQRGAELDNLVCITGTLSTKQPLCYVWSWEKEAWQSKSSWLLTLDYSCIHMYTYTSTHTYTHTNAYTHSLVGEKFAEFDKSSVICQTKTIQI